VTPWKHEDDLTWRALPPFGIEIRRDFRTRLTPAATRRFVALFRESGLIVARGQALSVQAQIELMELLGPVLRRLDGTGTITTEVAGDGARAALPFHADHAYTPYPFEAMSLHAVEVVDGASSTLFANVERGYATLPAELRAPLDAHCADMISPRHDALGKRAYDLPDSDVMLRSDRPAVLVHPRTGRRCVGVNEMQAARIRGMSSEHSRALLDAVFRHLYAPDRVAEHVWHQGDLVIWDNFTFQHARGGLAGVGRRVLQRVTVCEKGLWDMYPDLFPELRAFHEPAMQP
jgi:taurine dioxygenase